MKKTGIVILSSVLLTISCQNKEQKIKMKDGANIEFTDLEGSKILKTELSKSTGTFNYEIYGIENVSNNAISLHNQARELGQKGDYKNAIKKLIQANKEAPNWAYPLYDLAYTYLLQDDYDNALKYYLLTDKVAPNGFYTSKTALNTLEKEQKGELKKGLYKMYLSLEWIDDPLEKKEMIKLFIEKFPNFAPAWKDYSDILEGENRMKAIEKGLSLNPDIQTKESLLISKALMMNKKGDLKNATELLTEIILDKKATYGNVEMAKFVLHNITQK